MKYSVFAKLVRVVCLALISLGTAYASDISEGYSGDDAYIVSGTGASAAASKSPVQAEAAALQSARLSAHENFIEACRGPLPAGGGCREPSRTLMDVRGALQGAKVVHKQCEHVKDQPAEITCRVFLRVERKQLKKLCEKVREESGPSCAR